MFFFPSNDYKISFFFFYLQTGQDVYVTRKSVDGWWYGVSEGKRGRFPSRCVKIIRKIPVSNTDTHASIE